MKILVLSDRYPPYCDGGYEINCEVTVRGLEKRGHECFVLTSSYGLRNPLKEKNIYRLMCPLDSEYVIGPARRVSQLCNAFLGRRNYSIAKNVIKEVTPDIAYIWRMGNVSVFPICAVHDQRITAVYELGDYWLLDYKRDFVLETVKLKRLYRKFLFGGDKFHLFDFKNVLAVSEALKRHYVKHQFLGDHITVMPRGVPEEFVLDHPMGGTVTSNRGFRLLYAGRLVEEKGVHTAVECVGYLVNSLGIKNVFLDIVGNGRKEYVKNLELLIGLGKLHDQVKIRGQIPRNEVVESYANYDVCIYPSIWEEPFPNTIIEAMARGLPVIASNVGGVSEVVTDGENGLLVAPNNPIMLAETLKRLMADAHLLGKMRTAGIRTVKERFMNKRIIDQKERYLLNLFGDRIL